MPSVPTLLGILVAGLVITIGFAFTLIGLVGEAVAVLALLGLLARGVEYTIRKSRRAKAAN